MNLRPRHLVCMFLLLSALRAAEGSAFPELRFTEHTLRAFLLDDAHHAKTQTAASEQDHTGSGYIAPELSLSPALTESLLPASTATLREAWSMRPPAAHCASLHADTSRA